MRTFDPGRGRSVGAIAEKRWYGARLDSAEFMPLAPTEQRTRRNRAWLRTPSRTTHVDRAFEGLRPVRAIDGNLQRRLEIPLELPLERRLAVPRHLDGLLDIEQLPRQTHLRALHALRSQLHALPIDLGLEIRRRTRRSLAVARRLELEHAHESAPRIGERLPGLRDIARVLDALLLREPIEPLVEVL